MHLKPINNKKQVVKQNTDEFRYKGETRTSYIEEIENENEGDDDDGGGFNGNDDDDDDDNDDNDEDIEIDDDDNNGDNDDDDSDSGDVDGHRVDGVTANGDISIIKHLIGEI